MEKHRLAEAESKAADDHRDATYVTLQDHKAELSTALAAFILAKQHNI